MDGPEGYGPEGYGPEGYGPESYGPGSFGPGRAGGASQALEISMLTPHEETPVNLQGSGCMKNT